MLMLLLLMLLLLLLSSSSLLLASLDVWLLLAPAPPLPPPPPPLKSWKPLPDVPPITAALPFLALVISPSLSTSPGGWLRASAW